MWTPKEMALASQSVKALITSKKKPRVKKVIGKVIIIRKGRTTALIAARITAKRNALIEELTVNPETKWETNKITIVRITNRMSKNITHS